MASKMLLVIFAVVMATALVTAETFDDLTDADLDEMLDLMSKRADSNDANGGMVFDDAYAEMAKRGLGRGKFIRCVHPLNGFQCVCDKRQRKTSPKYYRVCGYE
ncbi:uncharacterized protein LOC115917941 [Strongylocentrotus purpuratus]|uniref:Uncharacterized protein n=1 Tax=Strongylocentrotus purpuratus TaxID=7668 RepID=A0A7M7HIK0_STRPU|nr:uncharacterized protein LOC115917941 [Strongylocentrotus purpuratus]